MLSAPLNKTLQFLFSFSATGETRCSISTSCYTLWFVVHTADCFHSVPLGTTRCAISTSCYTLWFVVHTADCFHSVPLGTTRCAISTSCSTPTRMSSIHTGPAGETNTKQVVGKMPADSDVPLPPNPLLDDIARGHHHHPHHFKATTTTPGKLVLHSFRGYGAQNSKEHFAKGLKSQLLALKRLSSDKKISSPHRYRHHHEKQQKVRVKRDHYATKRTLYGESNISDLESLLHPNNVGKPFEDPTRVGKDDPSTTFDTSLNAAMMNPVEGSSRYSAGIENASYHGSRKDDYNEKSKDVSAREHLKAEGYHGDIKQDASDLGYIKEASYHDKMKDHKDIKEKIWLSYWCETRTESLW